MVRRKCKNPMDLKDNFCSSLAISEKVSKLAQKLGKPRILARQRLQEHFNARDITFILASSSQTKCFGKRIEMLSKIGESIHFKKYSHSIFKILISFVVLGC